MRGVALIPALIGTLILAVLIAVMAGLIHYHTREAQSLTQKLEIIQLQQSLFGTLNTPEVCGCNMDPTLNASNSTPLTFDSTSPQTARLTFDRIFSSCAGNSPSNPVLTVNQAPTGLGSGVQVAEIALENIQSTGTAGAYSADLTVAFASQSLVMGRRPAKVGINFHADISTPTAARIVACSTGAPFGAGGPNPPGTPGANCGPGNQGVVMMRELGSGSLIPVCCSVTGINLNCTPL